MTGRNLKTLLIAAGLATALAGTVPAVTQASRFVDSTSTTIAAESMIVKKPVSIGAVKKTKKQTKHKTSAMSTKKAHTAKKKAHTATIVYKHHHKKAKTVTTKSVGK